MVHHTPSVTQVQTGRIGKLVKVGPAFVPDLSIKTIEVLAGEEKKSFFVHRNLVVSSSDLFKKALNGAFKENNGVVPLPQFSPELVTIYLQWLYTGEVLTRVTQTQGSDLTSTIAGARSGTSGTFKSSYGPLSREEAVAGRPEDDEEGGSDGEEKHYEEESDDDENDEEREGDDGENDSQENNSQADVASIVGGTTYHVPYNRARQTSAELGQPISPSTRGLYSPKVESHQQGKLYWDFVPELGENKRGILLQCLLMGDYLQDHRVRNAVIDCFIYYCTDMDNFPTVLAQQAYNSLAPTSPFRKLLVDMWAYIKEAWWYDDKQEPATDLRYAPKEFWIKVARAATKLVREWRGLATIRRLEIDACIMNIRRERENVMLGIECGGRSQIFNVALRSDRAM
ncbi:hypothetical protein EJ08DRAFT_699342 [Tothia fuscella]|uniref:BTB domain-containing protein n=1 Tax=Tothia fuscella TaxID=1048955 RepID=A0A9P4NN93_9PEZI|nr:hypothetical protein EJ08DRAFT_699342 [Tothia fuscella]